VSGAAFRRALLLPFLAACGISALLAYVQGNLVDQGLGDFGLYQPTGTLLLRLEKDASSLITDGSDITALVDSMARWTAVTTSNATITRGSDFDLPNPIDASDGLADDGINRLYFAATDSKQSQPVLGTAIAVSFFYIGGSGQIVDCDIVLNERLYTFSTATPGNPNQSLGSGTYDIGEIATHEMGHCLGFDHSPVAGRFSATTGLEVSGFTSGDFTYQSTMYPYGTHTIQGRSLSQDDISGVSFIYPNSTLTSTTGTIAGRVLDGGSFAPIKGAHVVAVSTSAPDIPLVGVLSDVQAGGVGGEYRIVGLPPGSYYIRIEPLVNTSNRFSAANTHFTSLNSNFPWEFYNGAAESGFDVATDRTAIQVLAGQTVTGIDILTNVAAADPNEPNNTRAAATPIACEQVMSSSIVPLGDVDYYSLPITSPTHLQIDLNASRSGSPLDPIVGLFDAAGVRLAFADNTVGLDPLLDVDLSAVGTYYVAVASYNDTGFSGSDSRTVGNYALTPHCTSPSVRAGTCPGRILYAGSNQNGTLNAISDADRDLRYEGVSMFTTLAGTTQTEIASRRDGGICVGGSGTTVSAFWDDTGDFSADRTAQAAPGLADVWSIAAYRHAGVESLFVGDLFGGGTIRQLDDRNGDLLPERSTTFTDAPYSVQSLAVDETGLVYVLDGFGPDGSGAIEAFRDLDGDGIADLSTLFLPTAPSYAVIAARRPGELYAADLFAGQIDRIVDSNGDGIADSVMPYATGLSLDVSYGMTIDADDVLYAVDGGTRVLALPDDNGDGAADRQVQFSPLLAGLAGISFGPGPPEIVSPPYAYHPVTVTPAAGGLMRLTWEDQGPTVPSYNIYEGTLGQYYTHAPRLCHVTGTLDGTGARSIDVTPVDGGSHYYLVTASDACGEGSAGRSSDGRRRPMPAGTCG